MEIKLKRFSRELLMVLMPKYIITWTSKITGYSGRGTYAFPNKETARRCIKYQPYQDIDYQIIPAPPGTPLLDIKI